MVYIVLYNTEYQRQFEVVMSRKRWNKLVEEYGTVDAAVIAILQSAVYVSDKRTESFENFLDLTRETGELLVSVSPNKKSKGEYYIGNRARRRTKRSLQRMDLDANALAKARKASSRKWKTQKELKEKYDKDYSKKAVEERDRTRW